MGKYILTIFCALAMGLTSVSLFAGVTVERAGKAVRYHFSIDSVDVRKAVEEGADEDSNTVYLRGLDGYVTKAQKVGDPEIPVIRFYVDAKGDIEAVGEFGKASSSLKTVTPISGIVKPVQPPRVKIKDAPIEYVRNDAVYDSNTCYGEDKLIHIDEAGSIRGWNRHVITVFPMCYNPEDEELVWRKYIRIRVTGNIKPVEEKTQNINETIAFVVGEQFKESVALQRYINFKESLGYIVKRIDMNDSDMKKPADIRKALQELLNSSDYNLQHALLIGDIDDVPSKSSDHIYGVTDHYYRAIDTDDYKSDINGPDIGVGRLSAASEEDLQGIVDKYIRYQVGDFERQTWLKEVSFLGTNDYRHWELAEATHDWVIDKHMSEQGFLGQFPDERQVGGDRLYYMSHDARNDDIMKFIKKGRTIVNYSGHGATTFWDAPRMTQEDVRSIDNKNAIPFVISNACITSQFQIEESFGETWQRHPYGAIVFWGSMDSTYWDEDDVLEKRMYDGIFENGYRDFKTLTQHALSMHWLHFGGEKLSKYYWETYVMLGDPSIRLRLNKTEKIKLHGPSEVSTGQSSVYYMATNEDGQPVSGVRVSLRLNSEELIVSAETNEHGMAHINLDSLFRGTGTFTVSAALADAGLFQSELRISEN